MNTRRKKLSMGNILLISCNLLLGSWKWATTGLRNRVGPYRGHCQMQKDAYLKFSLCEDLGINEGCLQSLISRKDLSIFLPLAAFNGHSVLILCLDWGLSYRQNLIASIPDSCN
ncbi:hypothetical protein Y1Q_0015860 [Alligator mississippiensis]|uniref:Uncharacterized protein n=1 Tax=Alligator mississippiensis TaxID=8496 RepID=A0A151MH79_ALLMI|nr:hypothetical protein Y1Q_0015860 [Alligator mississippiensis]